MVTGEIDGQTRAECGNCSKCWPIEGLTEARALSARTEPGGEIPAGECPDCGALCYIIKQPNRAASKKLQAVRRAHRALLRARRDENGGNDEEHDAAGALLDALDDYYKEVK